MFQYDKRLGIPLPSLQHDWFSYSVNERQQITLEWETIRGTIPDRIGELEGQINRKQAALNEEENFDQSCRLNTEISELASIINDLWLWFRTSPDVDEAKKTHA
ncbi:hypothetical protein M3221_00810 [Domibacillus indicus]|jgi:hypothetical protein|uniref:hypothetical protein n=1 Tax=Domibacillus TaxID=1433999 RepID=UPI001F59C867|nr:MULTISPECIES: hypothetical protein [Domibacillus]MCI2254314.1 hypothetical protein [Domibacillus sp. PGB-M46]MCM3786971.1 hypothetical protein [Domibacillus indicus]